jgi:hypothetical protein
LPLAAHGLDRRRQEARDSVEAFDKAEAAKAAKVPQAAKAPNPANDAGWELSLAKLKAYKAEHGDCNVPHRWAEDQRLGRWVGDQRAGKRKVDRGEPSRGMTVARAAKLEALGFAWAVSAATPLTKEERVEERGGSPKVQAVKAAKATKAAPKREAVAKAAAGHGGGMDATLAEGVGVTKRAKVEDPNKPLRSSSTQRMVSNAPPPPRPEPAIGRSGARLTAPTPLPLLAATTDRPPLLTAPGRCRRAGQGATYKGVGGKVPRDMLGRSAAVVDARPASTRYRPDFLPRASRAAA